MSRESKKSSVTAMNALVATSPPPAAPLPATLDEPFKKVQSLLRSLRKKHLEAYYGIGEIILIEEKRVHEADEKVNVIAALAEALDVHPRVLYQCRLFRINYEREDLQGLLDGRIEWSHVVVMGQLPNQETRQQVQAEIVENHWTVADTKNRVRELCPAKPRGPGRNLSTPSSAEQAVARLVAAAEKYARVGSTVFGEEFDVLGAYGSLTGADLSPQQQAKLEEAIEFLRNLARQVQADADRLSGALEDVRRKIVVQEQYRQSEVSVKLRSDPDYNPPPSEVERVRPDGQHVEDDDDDNESLAGDQDAARTGDDGEEEETPDGEDYDYFSTTTTRPHTTKRTRTTSKSRR